jgi:FMN phosphatase YigB (HAD superfamily)
VRHKTYTETTLPKDREIRVVLFDLGGVLVELSGVSTVISWMANPVCTEELFRIWLTSPAVRAFERGRIDPNVFADQLIVEMSLQVGRAALLKELTGWPVGTFPGALELLARIPRRYTRATLSNTNALHWPEVMGRMKLEKAFDHHFASHLTGKIKPDEDAFQHVTDALQCEADEVLFLDDNRLNVDAAKKCGLHTALVRGVPAAERALLDFGVIQS